MSNNLRKLQYSEGGIALPSDFSHGQDLQFYVDSARLTPNQYDVVNDDKGGKVLVLKEESATEVCVAYVPNIDFSAKKFDPSVLPALNSAFERTEAAIDLLRYQADKALGGGVCDDDPGDTLDRINERIDINATGISSINIKHNELDRRVSQIASDQDAHIAARFRRFFEQEKRRCIQEMPKVSDMWKKNQLDLPLVDSGQICASTEIWQEGPPYYTLFGRLALDQVGNDVWAEPDPECEYDVPSIDVSCRTYIRQETPPCIVGHSDCGDSEFFYINPTEICQIGANYV